MKILCPEYILWENGEIYSGYAVMTDDKGRIKKVMSCDKMRMSEQRNTLYLKGLLIPGLINAHGHLELSWLAGKNAKINGIEAFYSYMKGIHNRRPDDYEVLDSIYRNVAEMYKNGIEVCADISNTGISFLPKEHSAIKFHTFVEVFAKDGCAWQDCLADARKTLQHFNESDKNTSSFSLHTLFTSSPELIRKVADEIEASGQLHSIHFLESNEERLWITEGRPIQGLSYTNLPEHIVGRPADIAARFLPQRNRVLFVHNTFITERDIIELLDHFSDPWFCFCPSSNLFMSGQLPPLDDFVKHTDKLVIGTDSLATAPSLNLFNEMRVLLEAHPSLDFGEVLKMATINGAKLLGVEKEYGSISPGKKPGLIQIADYSPEKKDLRFKIIKRIA